MSQPPHRLAGRRRRALLSLLALVATLGAMWAGIGLLSDTGGPARLLSQLYRLIGLGGQADLIDRYGLSPLTSKLILAVVALLLGVCGIWMLYITVNRLVDLLGPGWERRVRPWIFIAPALAMVGFFLIYPTIRTVIVSITQRNDGTAPWDNYLRAFTDPSMLTALRNNVIWLVLGTTGSVIIGLIFATMADRVKREALAKTFVFLPLSISMVGAAVIWRFVYYWRPSGQPQIGLANAVITSTGGEPVAFFQTPGLNTLALIVIMVWLQTGFAMVILSAAIKGVPNEMLEAARIDGAGELRIFLRVIIPSIRGSLITVTTTVLIAILKVFDIIFVTTGGNFGTDVVAHRMFLELIRFRNPGGASALAVILLIAVIPIMMVNIRNLRRQGIGAR